MFRACNKVNSVDSQGIYTMFTWEYTLNVKCANTQNASRQKKYTKTEQTHTIIVNMVEEELGPGFRAAVDSTLGAVGLDVCGCVCRVGS